MRARSQQGVGLVYPGWQKFGAPKGSDCPLCGPCRPVTHLKLLRKNKAPLTRMSHGTPVKQPSPKCCSRTTLRFRLASGNGTDGLFPGRKVYSEKARHFGGIPLKSRVSRERTGASVTCLITSARAIFSMAIVPRPTAITDLRRGARAKIKEGLNTCCSHRKTRTRYQPRMPIPTPL
jgi:hypothetical protein